MARHFNLRNDGNETLAGVLHNVFHFFLGVISAVFLAVKFTGGTAEMSSNSLLTPSGYFLQFWVFFNLNAPALVFGQVPVKAIDFISGQHVDEGFDLFNGKKIPPNVQHGSPISKSRVVFNVDSGEFCTCRSLNREKLDQRLNTVKQSSRLPGLNLDLITTDL